MEEKFQLLQEHFTIKGGAVAVRTVREFNAENGERNRKNLELFDDELIAFDNRLADLQAQVKGNDNGDEGDIQVNAQGLNPLAAKIANVRKAVGQARVALGPIQNNRAGAEGLWLLFILVRDAEGDEVEEELKDPAAQQALQDIENDPNLQDGQNGTDAIGLPRSGKGVVYKRTDPKSGETYIGQAESPERFESRQREHNKNLGVSHDYEVLGRAERGTALDVMEESMIREHGGIKKEGGVLANKRHQMREKKYRESGGTVE